jgi:hypothetical protein
VLVLLLWWCSSWMLHVHDLLAPRHIDDHLLWLWLLWLLLGLGSK